MLDAIARMSGKILGKPDICNVCGKDTDFRHMYKLVLDSLDGDEYIPIFCSEKCVQRWLRIRNVKGWAEWVYVNGFKKLI